MNASFHSLDLFSAVSNKIQPSYSGGGGGGVSCSSLERADLLKQVSELHLKLTSNRLDACPRLWASTESTLKIGICSSPDVRFKLSFFLLSVKALTQKLK